MTRLSNSDLLGLLEIVRGLCESRDAVSLGARLTGPLRKLIGADNCTYSDLNPLRREVVVELVDPIDCPLREGREIFERYMHQHPLVAHFAATGDGRAHRISDFMTRAALHRLPLYNEFVRPFAGTEFQLAAAVMATSSNVVGLTLARASRDFAERDRQLLNLLRPHVVQARRTIALLEQLGEQLAGFERGLDAAGVGVVILDRAARPRQMTATARAWITEYFGTSRGDQLPAALRRWLSNQARSTFDGDAPALKASLVSRRNGRSLEVRRLSDGDGYCLLLEETRPDAEWAVLERLGLTPREADVLSWVSQGKTSSETAAILGSRTRTVEKHLERIYGKLGVVNRTAAAALIGSLRRGQPS